MKKQSSKVRDGSVVMGGGPVVVTFGSVTARLPEPPAAEAARNIERGRSALAAVEGAFLKKGVTVRARKGVALYRADPTDPQLLVRELDGAQQRGRLVGGRFEVV